MRATALCLVLVAATAGTALAGPSPSAVLRNPDQLTQRVIAVRRGPAGLTPATMEREQLFEATGLELSLPLYQQRADVVRVVVDHDDARLLLWIRREDLGWTVARATRITGRGEVGVWALPGAPLVVTGDGKRVAVRLVSGGVAVDGTIARRALVHAHVPQPATDASSHDLRGAIFRSPDGPALVVLDRSIGVRVIDRGPTGWVLVEHAEDYARVVGWVRERDLEELSLSAYGSMYGSELGMNHTARIDVDAGACMFTEDGAVVGVQRTRSTRYAYPRDGGAWSVYVNTVWGSVLPIVIDRAPGTDPARWTPCP